MARATQYANPDCATEMDGIPRDIQAFEARLSEAGIAPCGVRKVHSVLSASLKYALRMEVIWRNPAQAVTLSKAVRGEVDPPDIAGVNYLLEFANGEDSPLYPPLHLIAYTGIRRGEALGLKGQDVNLEGGIISIVQPLSHSCEQA